MHKLYLSLEVIRQLQHTFFFILIYVSIYHLALIYIHDSIKKQIVVSIKFTDVSVVKNLFVKELFSLPQHAKYFSLHFGLKSSWINNQYQPITINKKDLQIASFLCINLARLSQHSSKGWVHTYPSDSRSVSLFHRSFSLLLNGFTPTSI